MAVITISRQYGSGGDEIAEQVCNLLGYRLLDKRLLQQVAVEVGLSRDEAVDFSEEHYRARSFFASLFGPRQRVVAEVSERTRGTAGATEISVVQLDEEQCIALVRAAVNAAYARDNMVIVGRGSQAILADKPGVLHVRIQAPLEWRLARIREKEHLSPVEARSLIDQRDLAAAQYLDRFFHIAWDDPQHYHLVINTGRCDLDLAAQVIVSAAQHLSQQVEQSGSKAA